MRCRVTIVTSLPLPDTTTMGGENGWVIKVVLYSERRKYHQNMDRQRDTLSSLGLEQAVFQKLSLGGLCTPFCHVWHRADTFIMKLETPGWRMDDCTFVVRLCGGEGRGGEPGVASVGQTRNLHSGRRFTGWGVRETRFMRTNTYSGPKKKFVLD